MKTNNCTTKSIWVCMIDGEFLVAKGHAAWRRKSDAVLAFKNSEYWKDIIDELMQNNPDLLYHGYRGHVYWDDNRKGKELEDTKYQELLETERVTYYEIEPVPDWI